MHNIEPPPTPWGTLDVIETTPKHTPEHLLPIRYQLTITRVNDNMCNTPLIHDSANPLYHTKHTPQALSLYNQ